MQQTDRYFEVSEYRRVKLRTIKAADAARSELIEYERPETEGIRVSRYRITPVRSEDGACAVPKGPPIVVVEKSREVLLWDNVRIHLDTVSSLGNYLELEAVIDEAHDETTCRRQVDLLLSALSIDADDLVKASYADLVLRAGS